MVLPSFFRTKAYDVGVTPEQAVALLRSAAVSADGQRRLFETMLASDPDIFNAASLRSRALNGLTWAFVPKNGTQPPQRPRGFRAAVTHLAQAPLFGYAVCSVEWGPGWQPVVIHPWPYAATDVLGGKVHVRLADGELLPADDPRIADRLIVAVADPHDPAGSAALRPCVLPWVTRVFVLRSWRRFVERRAEPWTVGKPPSGSAAAGGKTPLEALAQALAALKAGGVIAVPSGTEVDVVDAAQGDAANAFDRLMFRTGEQIYRAILGDSSVLMGGPDGSRAAAEVRYRQMDTVGEADARLVAEVLQEQLVDRYLAGLGRKPGEIEVVYSWNRELTALESAQLLLLAAQIGLPFDYEEAAISLGLPQPKATSTSGFRVSEFGRGAVRGRRALDALVDVSAERLSAAAVRRGKEILREIPEGVTPAQALAALRPGPKPDERIKSEVLKAFLNAALLGVQEAKGASGAND